MSHPLHLCDMVNRRSRRIACCENPNVPYKGCAPFLATPGGNSSSLSSALWTRLSGAVLLKHNRLFLGSLLFCVLCLFLMWWTNYVHPIYRYEWIEHSGSNLCQSTRYPDTFVKFFSPSKQRKRGSVVGWITMLQAGRSLLRFPMWSLKFFNLPYPSSRTVAPGVDSASKRNEYQESSWWVEGGEARKTDNLTAIYELTV
jgi:hypothetical protein